MAERYWQDLKRACPQGPYHVLGWSFGGLVAHAMAERHPDEVHRVYLVEPPQVQENVAELMRGFAQQYAQAMELWQQGQQAQGPERELLERRLRDSTGSLEIPPDLIRLDQWIPFATLGSIFEAAAGYRPRHSRAQGVLLLSDTIMKSERDTVHNSGGPEEYISAWSSRYATLLQVLPTPGSHLDMLTDPDVVSVIADLIRDDISKA